jgi:transposase
MSESKPGGAASTSGAVPRRTFTEEFKREAAKLAIDRGNVSAVARELGIADSALHRWKAALNQEAQGNVKRAFPGRGNPQDEELAKLQRELARVKMENEILKKAVGIFTELGSC